MTHRLLIAFLMLCLARQNIYAAHDFTRSAAHHVIEKPLVHGTSPSDPLSRAPFNKTSTVTSRERTAPSSTPETALTIPMVFEPYTTQVPHQELITETPAIFKPAEPPNVMASPPDAPPLHTTPPSPRKLKNEQSSQKEAPSLAPPDEQSLFEPAVNARLIERMQDRVKELTQCLETRRSSATLQAEEQILNNLYAIVHQAEIQVSRATILPGNSQKNDPEVSQQAIEHLHEAIVSYGNALKKSIARLPQITCDTLSSEHQRIVAALATHLERYTRMNTFVAMLPPLQESFIKETPAPATLYAAFVNKFDEQRASESSAKSATVKNPLLTLQAL